MRVSLGDVLFEYSLRNKQDEDISVYSVTNTKGFCKGYFSKDVSSKDKKTYKIVPRGYFAYNPSRINVGSIDYLREQEKVIVSPLYVVFGTKDSIDKQFLLYFLKSEVGLTLIKASSSGSVRDILKFTYLRKFNIELPDIEEQRRRASVLTKIDNLIIKCTEYLRYCDNLVKSRFIELFGEVNHSNKFAYKRVLDFTKVISGGTPARNKPEYWSPQIIPWIKTTELQNNVIDNAEERISGDGLNSSAAKVLPKNTVLIAMYGQGKTRGMTGFLTIEACTNQACAAILPSEDFNPMFLWMYFIMSYDDLRDLAKGGNQPNLNCEIIKNYRVICPPISLQNEFVDFFKQVDKSKLAVQKSLDELEILKKSLMQKYFG